MHPFLQQPQFSVSAPPVDASTLQNARERANRIDAINWPTFVIAAICGIWLGWAAGLAIHPAVSGYFSEGNFFGFLAALAFSLSAGIVTAALFITPFSLWCRFWRLAKLNLEPISPDDAVHVLNLSLQNSEVDAWRGTIVALREITVGELAAMEEFCETRRIEVAEKRKSDVLKRVYRPEPISP